MSLTETVGDNFLENKLPEFEPVMAYKDQTTSSEVRLREREVDLITITVSDYKYMCKEIQELKEQVDDLIRASGCVVVTKSGDK